MKKEPFLKKESLFILSPGRWIGEGKITFSTSPEHMRFYTSWVIEKEEGKIIKAVQEVNIQGSDEKVINHFSFLNFENNTFSVELENELMGKIEGTGIVDERSISWEFKGSLHFEGFEVYERQENGDFMFHAEYSSSGTFRTIIEGRIWFKPLK